MKLSWAIFLNNISGEFNGVIYYSIDCIGICTYIAFQAYFLPIYFQYTSGNIIGDWLKPQLYLEPLSDFLGWPAGGMIEVATFKMPAIVFWYDSGYHTVEGIVTALLLAFFYKKFKLADHPSANSYLDQ